MSEYRETSRQPRSPQALRVPQLYTPTPEGFERRLRAWLCLPTDDVLTPDAGDVGASPEDRGARDRTRGTTPVRKGRLQRRGKGPNA
jgi:hypothetical protein